MEVTIKISDEMIEVIEERVSGSHIAFYSAGLTVYVMGQSKFHHPDCVRNLAMQCCEARHIPVISLRDAAYKKAAKKQVLSETRDMFGGKK